MDNHKLDTYFDRVSKGDKDAFAVIYNELKTPVYTVIYRIVKSKEVSEEIMQEVFLKIYKYPAGESIKNKRAWIFKITRNLALDALRKKQDMNNDFSSETYWSTTDIDLRIDLEQAINKLECSQREILTLHLNAGFRFVEISDIVGLSLPATYRRYRKALKTIKNSLDGGAL